MRINHADRGTAGGGPWIGGMACASRGADRKKLSKPDGITVRGNRAVSLDQAADSAYDAQERPIEHSRYTWPIDGVRISDHYSCP